MKKKTNIRKSRYLTQSLEDYLKVILELKDEDKSVRITDLAGNLKVAKSSVNQAITKLMELNLIQHDKYGPITLTAVGEKIARQIKKRHQILTRFFIECIKVDPGIAEQDACQIEHYISQVTMERLNSFLISVLDKQVFLPKGF